MQPPEIRYTSSMMFDACSSLFFLAKVLPRSLPTPHKCRLTALLALDGQSTLKRICLVHTLKRPWQVKTRSFNQRLYSVHSYSWVQNTTVVTEEQEQEHSDGAAAACGVGDDAATTTTPPELLQTRTSWKTRLGRQPAQPQSAVSATAPLAVSSSTSPAAPFATTAGCGCAVAVVLLPLFFLLLFGLLVLHGRHAAVGCREYTHRVVVRGFGGLDGCHQLKGFRPIFLRARFRSRHGLRLFPQVCHQC